MGLLDKLLGRPEKGPPPPYDARPQQAPTRALDEDQAIERYRYLLRTAPPEAIERVHEEAFARLSPEQRAEVLRDLSSRMPPYERSALSQQDADPRALARLATRAEVREPGLMDRMLGRWGGGGAPFGASLLTSFAAGFAGSLIANQLFDALHDGGSAEGVWGDADGPRGEDAPAADAGDEHVAEADYGDDGAGADFDDGVDVDFDV